MSLVDEATQAQVDEGYFPDEEEQVGFEDMGMNELSVPMLLICQSNSEAAIAAGVKPGELYNSITKKSYGTSIKVTVAYWQVQWVEWVPNGGGFAGRYAPGAIEVKGNNYDGMTNPKTGNDIVETWLYYVLMPDHLQDGPMVFSSTPGNMKYLKNWNTQMKYLMTPKGKPAAMYKGVWQLTTSKDQNKQGRPYYSFKATENSPGVKRVGWITKELQDNFILPLRLQAPEARLQLEHQAEGTTTDIVTDTSEDY